MVKRSARIRLSDMLEAIDGAAEIVEHLAYSDYQRQFATRKAIERCVEIISEASRHIPAQMKSEFPDAHWTEIKAIGNLLRHEYQRVDDLVMWRIATRYLPDLRPIIVSLLAKTE